MELSMVIPMWMLVAFGSVAYPATGWGITKGFNKATGGKAPLSLSAFVFAFWPVVLALASAGFPVWAVVSVIRNYVGSIGGFLGRIGGEKIPAGIVPNAPATPFPERPYRPGPEVRAGRTVRTDGLGHCIVESVGPNGLITVIAGGSRHTLTRGQYVPC